MLRYIFNILCFYILLAFPRKPTPSSKLFKKQLIRFASWDRLCDKFLFLPSKLNPVTSLSNHSAKENTILRQRIFAIKSHNNNNNPLWFTMEFIELINLCCPGDSGQVYVCSTIPEILASSSFYRSLKIELSPCPQSNPQENQLITWNPACEWHPAIQFHI